MTDDYSDITPSENHSVGSYLKYAFIYLFSYIVANLATQIFVLDFVDPRIPIAWYPPPAVTIVFLYTLGFSFVPVVVLTQLILAFVFFGLGITSSVLIPALVIPVFYSIFTYIVKNSMGIDLVDVKLVDILKFVFTSLLLTAVLSLLVNSLYVVFSTISTNEFFIHFINLWIGDLIGVILFVPLILYYLNNSESKERYYRIRFEFETLREMINNRSSETLVFLISYFGLIAFTYFSILVSQLPLNLSYINIVAILYFAIRYGYRGAIWTNLTINITLMLSIVIHQVNFLSLVNIQMLLLGITIVGLFVGILVKERKQSQEIIQQQRGYHIVLMEKLLYDVPEPVVLYNRTFTKIIDCNNSYSKLTGWTRDEILNQNLLENNYIPLEDETQSPREIILDTISQIKSRGAAISSFKGYHKDGKILNLVSRVVPIVVNGETIYRASYLDETVLNQAKAQIDEEHQRYLDTKEELEATREIMFHALKMDAVGRLAGSLAHDYNNNLQLIIAYITLIQSTQDLDEIRKHAENILQVTGNATKLTQDLLSFSKSKELELQLEDLNEMIKSYESMISLTVGKDIEITYNLTHGELPKIKVDKHHVQQMIINLLINARDAMNGSGNVTIATALVLLKEVINLDQYKELYPNSKDQGFVLLAISDQGKGIPTEIQHMVFEPFFTTKTDEGGTGLGLATAYGLMTQLGGYITFSSSPSGTTFYLYFPVNV